VAVVTRFAGVNGGWAWAKEVNGGADGVASWRRGPQVSLRIELPVVDPPPVASFLLNVSHLSGSG
jgi:hypothetical protein